ncbi:MULTISPECIES: response regulator transcription factor [Clavibacter]|uniref:DNA-binding response regulator n=2 Tax=Clavibacter TaxID=1573 RepID=A0A399NXK0_9MICO|nr:MULTISPECIES: response regulator transcription factor [Clavibacter]KDP91521.1 LuxR family transcriptional regulator [Clavibacter cf. michiganensis LMG 26808]RII98890.1 DNA-binding response regulator [Clavibacter michiganensis]UKF25914.1 response regulator transcription factor [Clavibacter sp. A6099]
MRIVIAEDSVLLRAGLVRLLTDAGHEIVAAVADASTLLAAVDRERPDLAIVDVRMPPTFTDEGIRAAVLIRAQDPDAAVLVLSQYVEERYAADLIASNSAGLGYLLKDRVAEVDEFLIAVADVGAGGTVFDPEVVAQIVVRSRRSDGVDALSQREAEVLQLMAEGRSNSAIADAIHVSESSIEKHVSAIFTKLDLPLESTGNRRVLAVLRYLARVADPRG